MAARHLISPLVIGTLLFLATPAGAAPDDHFDVTIADAKASMMTNPRATIATAEAADQIALATSDPARREIMHATAQWLMGEANLRIDEADKAIPLIGSAYATVSKLAPSSQLHGDLLLSMGGIATDRGDVSSALSFYQRAHSVFRGLKETRSEAKALIQIAILYYEANDWSSTLKYYSDALDSYNADPGLTVSIYNGRGIALKEQGKLAQAQKEFDQAIALTKQMNSSLLTATVLNNAARLALVDGDLAKADREIAESFRETGADAPPEFRRQQLALAAQLAFQRGALTRAAGLIDQVFAGADLSRTTLADREAHRTAYATFQALHRDDQALAHLKALKRLDDDATNLARSTSAALMGARFDFANQALKIANLKADDAQKSAAFERSRARTQRLVFLGATGATLLVIAMLLYALRTSRRARVKVQAANEDLAVTNTALGKALAAKTEFLATTSHEIRTPLNGILGMTQVMLVDTSLGPTTRDRVKVVHEAGVTMRALVDDILDVAKMETGNLTIEQAPFDLKVMIVEATALWTVQAEAKGLTFVRQLDGCPGMICGDAARVRQIVFNLLSNALKFTATGNVSLTIARAASGRFRITVADTGIGIPLDKVDTIFESFRQADTSTTRQFGGTGLGLSICRNLARAMGGDVTVVSVPGEGAAFVVDLPLVEAAPVAVKPCSESEDIDLLIVDRNPITRNMLKTLLSPHVGTIAFAASGADALACVAKGGIARVLVDDATIRQGDALADLGALAGASDAAVALLWPISAEAERAELLATGIDLVIAKPVTGVALIEQLLAAHPIRDEAALVTQAA